MPFGAARLNTLSRYIAAGAPPAGSWANWTTSDVGSQFVDANPEVGLRSGGVVHCGETSRFYMIGGQVSSPFDFYTWQFDRSGSTLTHVANTNIESSDVIPLVNFAMGIDLKDFGKAIWLYQQRNIGVYDPTYPVLSYRVLSNTSAGLTVSTYKHMTFDSPVLDAVHASFAVDPNDQSKICIMDRDGVILHCTFNDSTDTLTFDSKTTASTGANITQYCMIDNSGTSQIAAFGYDGTNWIVKQYDFDGSNSSSTTLVSGATLGLTTGISNVSYNYKTCTDFIYFTTGDAAPDTKMWTANWSGSSWTAPTTTQQFNGTTNPDQYYSTSFTNQGAIALEDNVWAKIHRNINNTLVAVRLFTLGLYKVESGTISQLGLIDLNEPSSAYNYSNEDSFGFSLSPDENYLCICSDNADTAIDHQSLTLIVRPTS